MRAGDSGREAGRRGNDGWEVTSTKLKLLSLSLSICAKSAMYVSLSMYVRNQDIASRYIIRTLAAAPIVQVVNGETLLRPVFFVFFAVSR